MLDGIKVLDFSQVLAGPTVTRMMAEMGAMVIKIEVPPDGDPSRKLPHIKNGRSGYFIQQNRGKKSICIDLKSLAGRQAIRQLIPLVDVVVESFRPGVMDHLGFGYEDIVNLNRKVVMCSISAFGQEGPLAQLPGYDNVAQAYSGVTSMIGDPAGPPALTAVGLGDVMTGVHGFAAVMSALFHRERTGEGQWVQASLLDSYFHCHEINIQAISGSQGEVIPTRNGSHHYAVTPFGIFRSHGKDIMIGVLNEQEWQRLCTAMNAPELAHDASLGSNALRCRNRAKVLSHIQDWLNSQDTIDEALQKLKDERVPSAPVLSVSEAMVHPHLMERGTIRRVVDPLWGVIDLPGLPLRFSGMEKPLTLEAPFLGQHNEEILVPIVGDHDYRKLVNSGIVVAEDRVGLAGTESEVVR